MGVSYISCLSLNTVWYNVIVWISTAVGSVVGVRCAGSFKVVSTCSCIREPVCVCRILSARLFFFQSIARFAVCGQSGAQMCRENRRNGGGETCVKNGREFA